MRLIAAILALSLVASFGQTVGVVKDQSTGNIVNGGFNIPANQTLSLLSNSTFTINTGVSYSFPNSTFSGLWLSASNTPSSGNYLQWNGTNFTWGNISLTAYAKLAADQTFTGNNTFSSANTFFSTGRTTFGALTDDGVNTVQITGNVIVTGQFKGSGAGITTGTIPVGALSTTGTGNSTTVLYGDGVYRAAGGGSSTGTTTAILAGNGTGGFSNVIIGSGLQYTIANNTLASTAGGGSVTNVTMVVPSGFAVSPASITSAGTFNVTSTLNGLIYGNGSNAFSAATANQVAGALTGATSNISLGNISIGNASATGMISIGPNLSYSDTNIGFQAVGNVNSYYQNIIQNLSNGTTASADLVLSNDRGTSSTFYANLGINSSCFTGSGAFNAGNTTYLTATSGDLALGTTTSNAIHFVISNSTTDAMTIYSNGTIGLIGASNHTGNSTFTNVSISGALAASGANLTSSTVPLSALNLSGTANSSTILYGNGTWALPTGGGGTGTTTAILAGNGSNGFSNVIVGSGLQYTVANNTLASTAGGGSVTNVSMAVPTGFSVSPTSITGAGTFNITTAISGLLWGNGSNGLAAASANNVASSLTGTTGTLNLASATVTLPSSFVTTTGNYTLGNITMNSLTVSTGNTSMTNFTTSGNGNITGTLAVTGNTSLANVSHSGNTTFTGSNNSFSGTVYTGALTASANSSFTNITASGNVSGTVFIGSGAALTSLPGGNITAGTVTGAALASNTVTAGSLQATNSPAAGNVFQMTNATVGAWGNVSASGGGIGNIAMTVPSFLSVSPSFLTSNGTFAITSNTSTALPAYSAANLTNIPGGNITGNTVLAGALVANNSPSAGQVLAWVNSSTSTWTTAAGGSGINSINVKTYTSGTNNYTPSAGVLVVKIEAVGAGGGTPAADASNFASGGGGGGYSCKTFTPAQLGAYATVVVGAGSAGATGGNTTITPAGSGGVITCVGGTAGSLLSNGNSAPGGAGGTASGGDINIQGQQATWGYNTQNLYSVGGSSFFGYGGTLDSSANSYAGQNYGGGAGGQAINRTTAQPGGSGFVIITEYIGTNTSTQTYNSYSSNQTLTGVNNHWSLFNGSNLYCTLPSPANLSGKVEIIKNLNASALTVVPNGGTIDGAAGNVTLQNGGSVGSVIEVTSDGSNYYLK